MAELEKEEIQGRQQEAMGCFQMFPRGGKIAWDDEEEALYREWLKAELETREEANFNEFDAEAEYRQKLREEAEERGGDKVEWEDTQELAYRQKYQEMRSREKGQQVVWDDIGERESRERMRLEMEERKNQPVQWDLDKWGNPI